MREENPLGPWGFPLLAASAVLVGGIVYAATRSGSAAKSPGGGPTPPTGSCWGPLIPLSQMFAQPGRYRVEFSFPIANATRIHAINELGDEFVKRMKVAAPGLVLEGLWYLPLDGQGPPLAYPAGTAMTEWPIDPADGRAHIRFQVLSPYVMDPVLAKAVLENVIAPEQTLIDVETYRCSQGAPAAIPVALTWTPVPYKSDGTISLGTGVYRMSVDRGWIEGNRSAEDVVTSLHQLGIDVLRIHSAVPADWPSGDTDPSRVRFDVKIHNPIQWAEQNGRSESFFRMDGPFFDAFAD